MSQNLHCNAKTFVTKSKKVSQKSYCQVEVNPAEQDCDVLQLQMWENVQMEHNSEQICPILSNKCKNVFEDVRDTTKRKIEFLWHAKILSNKT